MSLEAELTTHIYSGNETRLGSLNPEHVQISETNEFNTPREIDITHPLADEIHPELSYYDTLLRAGNKIFRPLTCDGTPCLYVIPGPKKPVYTKNTITITAVEVCSELGEWPIHRSSNFTWIVNASLITQYCGHLYDPGVITGPSTSVAYNGALTPLGILNKIQESIGEFQYRYVWDSGVIKRYIDFLPEIGKTHSTPVELGENAKDINYTITEVPVREGAGPTGKPSSANDDFHANRAAFEALNIAKGSTIRLFYSKDENGNEILGPEVAAPYGKNANEGWVVCDEPSELIANYGHINGKEKSSTTYPRLWTFDSSEANPINLYWDCIDHIRDHLQPVVKFTCSVADLKKLQGYTPEYYNTGDIIYIRIPGRTDLVECRITKTTKDPRKPDDDSVTVESHKTSFMAEFLKNNYKSVGPINIQ